MTPAQRSYVRRETAVSIGINAALSGLFAWLVFGGSDPASATDVAFDAVPQSFMIALMSTLVPTAITRKWLRARVVEPLSRSGGVLPKNLIFRALLVAVTAAVIGGALHLLLLPPVAPGPWSFAAVLPFKIAYGSLLALAISPSILRRALADVQAISEETQP